MRLRIAFVITVTTFGCSAGEVRSRTAVQSAKLVHTHDSVPTLEDVLADHTTDRQTVLVRAAVARWEHGLLTAYLKDVPKLRPIVLKTLSEDRFYDYTTASETVLDLHRMDSRASLYNKLVTELHPELGIQESLFHALLADDDVSVRGNGLRLLTWLDGRRLRREMPTGDDDHHTWISGLLTTALTDTDDDVAIMALQYALRIKASFTVQVLESVCHRFSGEHVGECVRLSCGLSDSEEAIAFLLRQLQAYPRHYEVILKRVEGILSEGELPPSTLFARIQKVLSQGDIDYPANEGLLRVMQKCDRYRATDYMLALVLSDKTGEKMSPTVSLYSRAIHVVMRTAAPEDIPQLIEAHTRRTNSRHFRYIGQALIKAGDNHYIRGVLEDYIPSDDERVLSDMEEDTGYVFDAIEVLKYALRETKPEWAYSLLDKGVKDLKSHGWLSLANVYSELNLVQGLPILEERLRTDPDVNNVRKIRRLCQKLRIRANSRARHHALEDDDPYVVRMGLRAFAEKPDKKKLERIIELTGHEDPVIAVSAVNTLNQQPVEFFSARGIEPEFLRSVILAYKGERQKEQCIDLIRQYRVTTEDVPGKNVRQCCEMLFSRNDRQVIAATQCLMTMAIDHETRSMILSFATAERIDRFLLEIAGELDSPAARAIKLCAPPEYGNIILPCVTCPQFRLSGRISRRLFPTLVEGIVLPEDWHRGTDQLLTRLIERKPELIDKLIRLSKNSNLEVAISAACYLMTVWPDIERAKQEQYLTQCLELSCSVKAEPQTGTAEYILFDYQVRHGWSGFPKNLVLKTTTRHTLDGKPYGKPFSYEGPMARTGHIQASQLTPGQHTCHMETHYEFATRDRIVSGVMKSPQRSFTVEN